MKDITKHLPDKLTMKDAFLFPVSSKEARLDIFIGGILIIFLLIIGWILNLGNRLNVVSRLSNGDNPVFRGFKPWGYTFRRGCISFATISSYLAPCAIFAICAFSFRQAELDFGHYSFAILSASAFVLGVFTLPGCMTVYAVEGDPEVLRQPIKAFQRAWVHKETYLYAWWIALFSIFLSFFGLLVLGVGFFFTSVWAWDVVGYAFTVAMYSKEGRKES